jgi:hypothetical protein
MYHHLFMKYLQNYTDDFRFGLNNRENERVFDTLLKQCIL